MLPCSFDIVSIGVSSELIMKTRRLDLALVRNQTVFSFDGENHSVDRTSNALEQQQGQHQRLYGSYCGAQGRPGWYTFPASHATTLAARRCTRTNRVTLGIESGVLCYHSRCG